MKHIGMCVYIMHTHAYMYINYIYIYIYIYILCSQTIYIIGELNVNPVFLPAGSHVRGSWQATVHTVAKSQTGLCD